MSKEIKETEVTEVGVERVVSLDDDIKQKLAEAVALWADKNLIGKPAILANAIYFSLENKMIEKIKEINKTFPN